MSFLLLILFDDIMSMLTIIKNYFHLNSNLHKSREKILKLRESKFRKILKHAYNNSKFYNSFYKSHGIKKEDLDKIKIEDLPIIDKKIVMENFNDIITTKDVKLKEVEEFLNVNSNPNDLFKNKYHIIHSSGSSGKLGIFVYGKNDWDSFFPILTRAYDFKFKKVKTVFFGAIDGHYASVSVAKWGNKSLMKLFNKCQVFDIKEPIANHIDKLNSFNPDILGGYFSGLKFLAELQLKGNLNITPKYILNTGEGGSKKDRKLIIDAFSAEFINSYGISECLIAGIGKDEYGGIALSEDLTYFEIKDDHVLITNLFNKTMPLIRYRLNDYLKISDRSPRGFPFTVVDDIIGRDELVIWLKNKFGKLDFIHPILIAEFYVKGLNQHQIIYHDENSFDFLAIINEEEREVVNHIKEKINHILKQKDMDNVKFDVKIVDKLNIDKKSGKFKLVISK